MMKTILILDDDRALSRRNEAALIMAFGEEARILVAYTAQKVLEFAKAYHIDIFVLDILGVSDDMDGIELAETLREEGYPYPVPIIIASVNEEPTYQISVYKRIRCYDYLTKPYNPEELVKQAVFATAVAKYLPNPYFEINQGSHMHKILRNKISYIEKVKDKRKIAIEKRGEDGKVTGIEFVPVDSFKSFVNQSVAGVSDFVQCNRTTVVNLYWVERYCLVEKCVILRECGTQIHVEKQYRETIERLVPTN